MSIRPRLETRDVLLLAFFAAFLVATRAAMRWHLHLPGHSPGSLGLWEPRSGLLLSGDAVYDGPLLDQLPGRDLRVNPLTQPLFAEFHALVQIENPWPAIPGPPRKQTLAHRQTKSHRYHQHPSGVWLGQKRSRFPKAILRPMDDRHPQCRPLWCPGLVRTAHWRWQRKLHWSKCQWLETDCPG